MRFFFRVWPHFVDCFQQLRVWRCWYNATAGGIITQWQTIIEFVLRSPSGRCQLGYHIEAKMADTLQKTFLNTYCWMKIIISWLIVHCSLFPMVWLASSGWTQNKRQTVTWTNDDPVSWRRVASLSNNKLSYWVRRIISYAINGRKNAVRYKTLLNTTRRQRCHSYQTWYREYTPHLFGVGWDK